MASLLGGAFTIIVAEAHESRAREEDQAEADLGESFGRYNVGDDAANVTLE